jgi:hypothetical protein
LEPLKQSAVLGHSHGDVPSKLGPLRDESAQLDQAALVGTISAACR